MTDKHNLSLEQISMILAFWALDDMERIAKQRPFGLTAAQPEAIELKTQPVSQHIDDDIMLALEREAEMAAR